MIQAEILNGFLSPAVRLMSSVLCCYVAPLSSCAPSQFRLSPQAEAILFEKKRL